MTTVSHRSADVDGQRIFYREAGDPARPTFLLLHGFPTSSHMFRDVLETHADEIGARIGTFLDGVLA